MFDVAGVGLQKGGRELKGGERSGIGIGGEKKGRLLVVLAEEGEEASKIKGRNNKISCEEYLERQFWRTYAHGRRH